MARIRQIKPQFWFDEELAACCSRDARLFFMGMWKEADREGRLEDRPRQLKAQIFPFEDDLTAIDIVRLIDQLVAGRFVFRYQAPDGRPLLWIRTFKKHQHFHVDEKDSVLPPPPDGIENAPVPECTVQAPGLDRAETGEAGPNTEYRIPNTELPKTENRESGIGSAPKQRGRASTQRTRCPEIFEISDSMRQWGIENCPNLNLEVETQKFLDYYRAKGTLFADWPSAWRNWMRNAPLFSGKGAGGPAQSRLDLHGQNMETMKRFVARGNTE